VRCTSRPAAAAGCARRPSSRRSSAAIGSCGW
jgi:hypothetical protein